MGDLVGYRVRVTNPGWNHNTLPPLMMSTDLATIIAVTWDGKPVVRLDAFATNEKFGGIVTVLPWEWDRLDILGPTNSEAEKERDELKERLASADEYLSRAKEQSYALFMERARRLTWWGQLKAGVAELTLPTRNRRAFAVAVVLIVAMAAVRLLRSKVAVIIPIPTRDSS